MFKAELSKAAITYYLVTYSYLIYDPNLERSATTHTVASTQIQLVSQVTLSDRTRYN